MIVFYCHDIELATGIDFMCCSSCHEDYEEGYYYLMEYESECGKYVLHCCCGCARMLEEHFNSIVPLEIFEKMEETRYVEIREEST